MTILMRITTRMIIIMIASSCNCHRTIEIISLSWKGVTITSSFSPASHIFFCWLAATSGVPSLTCTADGGVVERGGGVGQLVLGRCPLDWWSTSFMSWQYLKGFLDAHGIFHVIFIWNYGTETLWWSIVGVCLKWPNGECSGIVHSKTLVCWWLSRFQK